MAPRSVISSHQVRAGTPGCMAVPGVAKHDHSLIMWEQIIMAISLRTTRLYARETISNLPKHGPLAGLVPAASPDLTDIATGCR
jgi:hypothetical protein